MVHHAVYRRRVSVTARPTGAMKSRKDKPDRGRVDLHVLSATLATHGLQTDELEAHGLELLYEGNCFAKSSFSLFHGNRGYRPAGEAGCKRSLTGRDCENSGLDQVGSLARPKPNPARTGLDTEVVSIARGLKDTTWCSRGGDFIGLTPNLDFDTAK